METRHFKVYTGYADVRDIYQAMQSMGNAWERVGIDSVRVFFAGFTDVYVSIRAALWYHWSVANDPEWLGDAQDFLEDGLLRCRSLASRPRPEKAWLGEWKVFHSADELIQFSSNRLNRLTNKEVA